MHYALTLISAVALVGCAANSIGNGTGTGISAGTDEPVKIGDNLYKLGGTGNKTDTSGSAVKVRFFQQATTFCANKGLAMAPCYARPTFR